MARLVAESGIVPSEPGDFVFGGPGEPGDAIEVDGYLVASLWDRARRDEGGS